jgi:hypothetical protein
MVSVVASSHPSHHERESERETTSRSRAGRSRRPRGHTDITTIVLESQPTTGMTASPPAAQQPTSSWSVTLSSRVVASRCRLAHHHHHQHATLGGVAPAICVAIVLSVSGAYAIRGAGAPGAARCAPAGAALHADGQLPDDGPQGEDQPPSRWGGQSHHNRAQPREASRH